MIQLRLIECREDFYKLNDYAADLLAGCVQGETNWLVILNQEIILELGYIPSHYLMWAQLKKSAYSI